MGRRRVLRSPPAVAQRTEPCLNLPPELVRSIGEPSTRRHLSPSQPTHLGTTEDVKGIPSGALLAAG